MSKINDEFTKMSAPENNSSVELNETKEFVPVDEMYRAEEFVAAEESKDAEGSNFGKSIDSKKKNRALASLSTGVATAIAAVTVGITSMLNVSMAAEFINVAYIDGQIFYEVSVENMTEEETLTAYLYDSEAELVEAIDLKDEDGDGIISGSVDIDTDYVNEITTAGKKASYRLSLAGNVGLDVERDFDSYLVEIEKVSSYFDSVSGECHCSVDGCYHFTMNFTDDMGLFDNFEASIEDSFGNVAQCEFTENLHEEQKIYIGNLKGSTAVLKLTYTAEGKTQSVEINITI